MNIDHAGRVERVEGDKVFVVIVSNSACGTCQARKACGLSETSEKIVEVATADAARYAAGDEVVVSVRKHMGLRAVLLAYVMPLLVLLCVLAAIEAAGAGDGAAALGALAGVGVYYALLRLLSGRIAQQIRFTIHKI